MAEKNDLAERLKKIRETLKLKQKEFALRLKVSAPTYSELESGKYKPGYDFIYNISKEFGINLYYLMYGEGDMFIGPVHLLGEITGNYLVNKEEVQRFLWYFERSPMMQLLVLANFRAILNKEKETIDKEVAGYGDHDPQQEKG